MAPSAVLRRTRSSLTAVGVFHHMDDDVEHELLDLVAWVVHPGGRIVSVDPTFTDDPHRIAKLLISRDRGQHVRTPAEMQTLLGRHFTAPAVSVRHDLLRTPNTDVIIQAEFS